jgi:hypothetical protein
VTDPGQLALLGLPDPVRKLTDRQQHVLDALTRAGQDGLDADQAGALLCERKGIHGREQRCQFDGRNGKQVLEALKAKGLARYRRRRGDTPGAWLAATLNPQTEPETSGLQDGWDDLVRAGF